MDSSQSQKGPYIFFLSDWFTTAEEDWFHQNQYFSRYYRCRFFTLSGHGDVPLPEDQDVGLLNHNIDRLIAEINEVGEPVRLVAHGISVPMALIASVRVPRKIKSMVLVAPGFSYEHESIFSGTGFSFFRTVYYLLTRDPLGEIPGPFQRLYTRLKSVGYRTVVRYMNELYNLDIKEQISDLAVRTAIIVGDNDRINPETNGPELNELLANSHLTRFSNLGYNPHKEDPEVINGIIHDFIKKSDGVFGPTLEKVKGFFKNLLGF